MHNARLLGMLATIALLAGTTACDTPTALVEREVSPGAAYNLFPGNETGSSGQTATTEAEADAAAADSLVAEWTIAEDSVLALHAGQTSSSTDEHYVIPLGGGRVFDLIVPIGSTVTIYPDPNNPAIKHIVVKFPNGTVIHYIWDPATGKLKHFVKPAKKTSTSSTFT